MRCLCGGLQIRKVHKALGAHLAAIVGHWWRCVHDPARDVADAARQSLDAAFPAKKQPKVCCHAAPACPKRRKCVTLRCLPQMLCMFAADVLDLFDSLLHQSPQSFTESKEEDKEGALRSEMRAPAWRQQHSSGIVLAEVDKRHERTLVSTLAALAAFVQVAPEETLVELQGDPSAVGSARRELAVGPITLAGVRAS